MVLRFVFPFVAALAIAAAGEPSPVSVAVATRAPVVESLTLTGTVHARHRSHLSARTSGLVETMHVDAGDRVKRGEVLMELDAELAGLELEQIEGRLDQARIALAEADRLSSEAVELAGRGAFPKSEADTRRSVLDVSRAPVRQLEAEAKRQQSVVDRHRLVAPYDGVISERAADIGEWVETGTPVFELVSLADPRLDMQVPQEHFASIATDPPVTVELDAAPGRTFPAKVAAIVPVKDPVARTFLVRIEWLEAEKAAAPGMSGKAIFALESADAALQVPRDAIVRSPGGGAVVWTVEETNGSATVRPCEVTLGESLTDRIEVRDGLAAGARVVVRGNEALEAGQRVTVLPDTPANR